MTWKWGTTGEIACGYADGCLTLNQTILLAYHRGRMAPDHGVSGGLMAAVGLSAEAADARLSKAGLTRSVVGCDNSATGVTLAGWCLPGLTFANSVFAIIFRRVLDTDHGG